MAVPKNIFDNSIYDTAVLNVAIGGFDNAYATLPWAYFLNIQEKDFSGVEEVVADFDINAPVDVYDFSGARVASTLSDLPAGLYIVRQGNVSRKISVK